MPGSQDLGVLATQKSVVVHQGKPVLQVEEKTTSFAPKSSLTRRLHIGFPYVQTGILSEASC